MKISSHDIMDIERLIKRGLLAMAATLLLGNASYAQSGNAQKDTITLPEEPTILFKTDRASSTTAISTVSVTDFNRTPGANLANTLHGRLNGLTVLQKSGEPGFDDATLRIRGVGTYNNQDIAIFVDGFQTTYDFIRYLMPEEIESISVLKDAAALAPFGMKGSNGALWITTKRGKLGKPTLKIQASTGFQSPTIINKPLDSYGYASLYNEAISNDNRMVWSPAYDAQQLADYQSGAGTNVDWYDKVLNNRNARYYNATTNISGGSEFARYMVFLGFMDQRGLYDVPTDDTHANAKNTRVNLRTNLDLNMFGIFEGKIDIGARLEDRKRPNFDSPLLWKNLATYPANIYPVRNPNGSWPGTMTYPDNPYASLGELGFDSNHDRTIQANFTLKEKLDFLLNGLYVDEAISFNNWTRGSYSKYKDYVRTLNGVQQTTNRNSNYAVSDDYGTDQYDWLQMKAGIGFDRQFGLSKINSAISYLQYMLKVDAKLNGAAGVQTNYGYRNIGGRIHYSYDDRFFGELGFAYAGSDNYVEGNRYGFYPAVSAAWVLSKEALFSSSNVINYLKLRASAGKTGNDKYDGGRYLYESYYVSLGGFTTGTSSQTYRSGLMRQFVANPDLFAEESAKYNIGLDATLLNSIDLTIDAFINKGSGIITQNFGIPAGFGVNPPYENIGKTTTKGLEAGLTYHKKVGQLEYFIGGLASYADNTIDYMAEVITVASSARTGNPIGTPFGLQADGFYDITDFTADGALKENLPIPTFGPVQPGDVKYRDVNGDKIINYYDEVKIGNPFLPKFSYSINGGINFRNFDFKVLFQGASGRSINLLDAWDQAVAFVNNGTVYDPAQGRWAYYPDQGIDTRAAATYPRLTTTGNNNNYRNSTLWMVNGDYLRFKNAIIGYTIPSPLIGMSSIRIFANAANILTWSELTKKYDMDPEVITGYPALRSFECGLTVNF